MERKLYHVAYVFADMAETDPFFCYANSPEEAFKGFYDTGYEDEVLEELREDCYMWVIPDFPQTEILKLTWQNDSWDVDTGYSILKM